jgi:anti-sigma regulatory factor (Ser/Thr protein kinase)
MTALYKFLWFSSPFSGMARRFAAPIQLTTQDFFRIRLVTSEGISFIRALSIYTTTGQHWYYRFRF